MKRTLGLSLVVVLVGVAFAQAGITVNPIDLRAGDRIDYLQQTYSGGGNGGVFTWQVLSTQSSPNRPNPPAVGTLFYTFCTELTQYIGDPITLEEVSSASSYVPWREVNNKTDYSGVWLFEQWADSKLAFISHDSAADSHAVQIGIWRSLGFVSGGGYSDAQWAAGLSTCDTWLASMPVGWAPAAEDVLVFKSNQDQLFLASGIGSNTAVPEPVSLAVWSLIGAAAIGGTLLKRHRGSV